MARKQISVALSGVDRGSLSKVISKLHNVIKETENVTTKGLVAIALEVRKLTETQAPVTPVDLGNLRASYFVAADKGDISNVPNTGKFMNQSAIKTSRYHFRRKYGAAELARIHGAVVMSAQQRAKAEKRPNVYFGYTAPYAWQVHEMVDVVRWSRPGSDAKWFEKAIKRITPKIKEFLTAVEKI